ncbi:glycosyltransferase family 1 protein, partial [Streptomyces sp. SID7804]|nr:glycosyltransferase family 1 protein [Streptomyces sp. SID7804]
GALLLDPPLRAALGERGRRHVLSLHDVRHTAQAVADVYRDVLGSRPDTTRACPHRAAGGAGADRTTRRVEPFEHRESIHS